MRLLIDKIKSEGVVLPGNILKVNSFLNHQLDPGLMQAIGQQFANHFKDKKVQKVLTVESSGIAPALMTGLALNVPVIFARKQKPQSINDGVFSAPVYSYTKKKTNDIIVERQFLKPQENVLLIDDFLANGEAVLGMLNILKQAECQPTGIGIVIEKTFQPGAQRLKEKGFPVYALAKIKSLKDGKVRFE